ncbi:hypothetical protein CEXT_543481 [Caerostris extrusa]|uniref:Uncharacterized protein n=1 Tax=Caerostris extrusa TaxID=172846 RepID=A0AAV4VP39_CAEEX|nr:hypothetical protein CEXT_543481 [Caerostris extrusa]
MWYWPSELQCLSCISYSGIASISVKISTVNINSQTLALRPVPVRVDIPAGISAGSLESKIMKNDLDLVALLFRLYFIKKQNN